MMCCYLDLPKSFGRSGWIWFCFTAVISSPHHCSLIRCLCQLVTWTERYRQVEVVKWRDADLKRVCTAIEVLMMDYTVVILPRGVNIAPFSLGMTSRLWLAQRIIKISYFYLQSQLMPTYQLQNIQLTESNGCGHVHYGVRSWRRNPIW